MKFITLEQLNDCICKNLPKLPRDIDLVVGIPRSGMLAANIIGLYLNVMITDIDSLLDRRLYRAGNTRKSGKWIADVSEAQHILIVDDSISKGDAIEEAKEKIAQGGIEKKVSYMAVYALPTNLSKVDYHFAICNHPRMFEWNYMHHWGLQYACVDIDGVLCEDPGLAETVSKKKYVQYLVNAIPKFIPSKKIRCLVTCRREQYRSITEEWLKKYDVQYDKLYMLGNEERLSTNDEYGQFKARIYRENECFIFIESNYEQAVTICKYAGRQAFCVSNRTLIEPDGLGPHLSILRRDVSITIKRVIKKLLRRF